MICRSFHRFFHTNNVLWYSSSKSLLAKLRKKTGYTFSNCKKALELHNNDLAKAESWLKEQAQALGWSKAEKLQGRTTAQGLVAVMVEKNHGAVVEINCETDFVARNKQFIGLAETVIAAVLKKTMEIPGDQVINKSFLDSETVKMLPALDGKTLADHSALTIGSVAENIGIRRALCIKVHPDVKLAGCTHPAPANPLSMSFGKYGAILAYKSAKDDLLGTQLCQHIIGMNPQKIGQPEIDIPAQNADDETAMIYQEYLLDPSLTVQQVLIDSQAEILDFGRFEVGENIELGHELKSVETCG
ncbi:elongation factor Ts, mitochondrial isoform X4 [Venturia canescens]|nr:elongation factor Ts, mitochondrial isoform X4 [Venturia canescens]XP_043287706.1 elongation factor Ts, mitochondrial isoform X4 [Venturia canescens]